MNGGTAVFTIVAKNYLAYSRVLMDSVAEQHPDWQRYVILVDRIDHAFDPTRENFTLVLSADLAIPNLPWFHFKYTIMELSTAVKPYAFEYLFRTGTFDSIVYLDPDIKLYSPMHGIVEALESANVVLTPHLTGTLDDDRRPGEIDILRSGAFNLGFIGVARSPVSESFTAWWRRRLYDHCVVDLPRGLFVDQKWIDLVPGMFEGVAIVRDPGYNVAYWNLSHRIVGRSQRGYEVDGRPLCFFHFSGYDPYLPHALSRHQNRHKVQDLSVETQELLEAYREELFTAGHATCRKWPYAFGAFRNGVAIPDLARPIHHEVAELVDSIEDPFSDEGFQAFTAAWNEPVHDGPHARMGISRLAYRIYRTRADLQAAMPDIFGGYYRRFLEWMLISGRAEHGLGDAFLTTIADAIRTGDGHREGHGWPESADENKFTREWPEGGEVSQAGEPRVRLTRLALAIYQARPELQRFFPDPSGRDGPRFLAWLLTYGRKEHNLSPRNIAPLRREWRAVLRSLPSLPLRLHYEFIFRGLSASVFVRNLVRQTSIRRAAASISRGHAVEAPRRPAAKSPPNEEPREFGVNLVGYLRAETGVGQLARASFDTLHAAAVPTSIRHLEDPSPGRKQDRTVGPTSAEFPYATSLFHVNADQTAVVKRSLGDAFYQGKHNVGYWCWELQDFPDRWLGACASYQELWTPSTFCREAIGRRASIPVYCVPPAVAPRTPAGMDRQSFGLTPDRFVFLFAFDVLSVPERKNPLAAIRAFERAFQGDSRYELVLKVNNANAAPQTMSALRNASSAGAVRFLTSTLERQEMYALIQSADCAVSLHRSEGFGLFIAEAMYFGKPVIVTNYSGNTDFTHSDNALLVDYRLTPVGPNCQPYAADCVWADADVDHAASQMRRIAFDPDLRNQLSMRGSRFVREKLSYATVGQVMRQRLAALHAPLEVEHAAAVKTNAAFR